MIRFFQFLIAIALFGAVGYFVMQIEFETERELPKYQFLIAKYRPESEEYRNLYLHYSSLESIPMPVGSWEAFSSPSRHFILKVNEGGGFVLAVNPNANDDSEAAVTGILNITGQAFKAHHLAGSAKKIIPKSGHIVVKQYSPKEIQVIHPQSLEVIIFSKI